MSYTDTEINKLIFNRLSNAKYNDLKQLGKLNPNEFYITPDSEDNPINIKDTITNCLTNIPEDIKLELTDTEIVLKAGSVVYLPNGKNEDNSLKFEKIIIQEDISRTPENITQYGKSFLIYLKETNTFTFAAGSGDATLKHFYSNENEPEINTIVAYWYDLTNNLIKFTDDSGATWKTYTYSLPIAIFSYEPNKFISIDQVFNGFGYFDRTLFALPGVEGLIPNGRGKNGELINTKFIIENLIIRTFPEDDKYQVCTLYCNNEKFGVLQYTQTNDLVYGFYYDKNLNYNINKDPNDLYIDNKYPYCIISNNFVKKNGKIIALNLNTVFQAISYDDVNNNFENILNTEKSNCLTKVPNLITLNYNRDKSLTLKYGSKVYVPYGKDTFKIIEAKSDIQRPNNIVNKNAIITCNINFDLNQISGLGMCSVNNIFSGETQPEDFMNGYWYDTLNNKVYSNTVSEDNLRSLPIGYIDNNDELHVFNGFGFIGNTIFALPGIEGLIPQGRNLDNKLRNVKLKNYDIQLRAVDPQNSVHKQFAFATTGIGIYNYIYDFNRNVLANSESDLYDRFVAGKINISTDGKITDLFIDYPFSAVNYNEFNDELTNLKKTSYHKRRDITCAGEITATLLDSDEYIGLVINDNTTITFDISQLSFIKDIYTIKIFAFFPMGQKTVSLLSPANRPFKYINNKTPVFSNKLHWFELTTGKDWTTTTFLDIGDEG